MVTSCPLPGENWSLDVFRLLLLLYVELQVSPVRIPSCRNEIHLVVHARIPLLGDVWSRFDDGESRRLCDDRTFSGYKLDDCFVPAGIPVLTAHDLQLAFSTRLKRSMIAPWGHHATPLHIRSAFFTNMFSPLIAMHHVARKRSRSSVGLRCAMDRRFFSSLRWIIRLNMACTFLTHN